jgi:hypothetical protein
MERADTLRGRRWRRGDLVLTIFIGGEVNAEPSGKGPALFTVAFRGSPK